MRSITFVFGTLVAVAAPLVFGGTTSIGMVTARGSFMVDSSTVSGSATVFNGTTVETTGVAGDVRLGQGTDISLASSSRGVVYKDRFVVERGVGRVVAPLGYSVQAGALKIEPVHTAGRAMVAVDSNTVQVAPVTGVWNVTRAGVLLASVVPGHSLAFTMQDAGATAPGTFTGCIQKVGTHYVLRDETTNSVIELNGPDVAANAGKRVQLTGTADGSATPVTGASQFIQETSLTATGGKGCKVEIGAASAAGGGGGAAGASSAGLSTGATVAIIGGVAAAATIGGLAAAGTFSGSSSSSPQ